ncbi:MAG: TlpA family protein disulfide reductase [Anaerolineae bacterium]|nr:TlpA family protein disulfide reductase [Anaerolineae bacterium]
MRRIRLTLCLILLTGLLIISAQTVPIHAQTPENPVEQAALRVHLQNQRTNAYTHWIGGPLGNLENQHFQIPGLGEPLGPWKLHGMAGDPDLASDDLTRPVLLSFWTSRYSYCWLVFPYLSEVALNADEYAFDVVFVNLWDTETDALGYLAHYSPDLYTVFDENEQLIQRININHAPTNVLLDTDGTILAVHVNIITPTTVNFLNVVAQQPGEGHFVAADYADRVPQAELLPIELDDTPPITYNTTITGTISAEDTQDAYQFTGSAGDELLITLTAPDDSELDSYVALLTPDGEHIAENDDIDPGIIQDARMMVTLPADGVYIVVATRFLENDGYSEGAYELLITENGAVNDAAITEGDQPDATPPAEASGTTQTTGTIAYGETVTGTIFDTDYAQAWTFTGSQGDVITATMSRADQADDDPGGLDGYMQLIGPDGDILIEVDDSQTVMPVIETYELPADGTYTLVATRFAFANGLSTGAYTLTLEHVAALTTPPDTGASATGAGTNWLPNNTLPADLYWINYNEQVAGSLADDPFDQWYIFQGTAGDVITIQMNATAADANDETAPALDPFLMLTTLNGLELAHNDDASDTSTGAAITDFTLPVSATYLIRATRYGLENGPSTGDYTLIIATEAPAAAANIPSSPIIPGQIVTGSLDLQQSRARYFLTVSAGDWITISAQRTSGDLDLELQLYDPAEELIVIHPRSVNAGETRIAHHEITVGGIYQVEVRLNNLMSSGDYQLIVLPAAPTTVDPGAFVPAAGLGVEVVLIWNSATDLDLSVLADPPAADEQTSHVNDFCADTVTTPIERFTQAAGSPVYTEYTVQITYQLNCTGQSEPVNFLLAIAVDGEVVDVIGGTLAREGDTYTTQFSVAP